MLEYFQTQWLVAPFNRWQIFRNLPGYANTNSNIESFNATVKRDIIERIKISVSGTFLKMKALIIFYSTTNAKPFATMPAFYKKLKKIAENYPTNCFNLVTQLKLVHCKY